MHNVLDLFSGIGGFSLGLERTGGFTTSAFCEICPEARKVLRKHWADVPIYEDITKLTARELHYDGIEIDCITGGFPCQDISLAGKGEGIVGERSGLWAEMFRLIADVRPRWVIAENVSALRSKGLTLVLQNLCEIGYHAEWHCIPASAVGAHHQRDRIWIAAYPSSVPAQPSIRETSAEGEGTQIPNTQPCSGSARGDTLLSEVSDEERPNDTATGCGALPRAECWEVEPELGRVAHGIPRRVDRLKQLGNSVVPQIPELIGNAILELQGSP
jgi:DNA (cytosine-5)-methyltransferase 1